MAEIEAEIELLEDNESLAESVADALKRANSVRAIEQKLKALEEAQELLLNKAQPGHLLDNFLDEMLEFVNARDLRIKFFIISFIEKACIKDCDVMKKAIAFLAIQILNEDISINKKIITVIANLYPHILKWAANNPKDIEANRSWEAFSILKGRIMQKLDTDNEGIKTMTMKFLESVILAQSVKTEMSESGRGDLMNLSDVPRDHRYISYRKMQEEATHNYKTLQEQAALQHIKAQNLMVAITIMSTIARQRPEFIISVVESLEKLNGNLPPTLGTSQVKSVRKDMKLHLFRLHKHAAVIASSQLTGRITQLLFDLGVNQSELNRNLQGVSKRKRTDEPGPSKRSKPNEKKEDVYDDDGDYVDEQEKSEAGTSQSSQTAIDITTDYIFDRLNINVVSQLVVIHLVTLPETIPPSFIESFTPIATAGQEEQRRHVARLMAIQATAENLGPGVEQMKQEKLQQLGERQKARKEGILIPPTPATSSKLNGLTKEEFKAPIAPSMPALPKVKQQFDIVKDTKPLSKQEANELFGMAVKRVMDAERRVIQGGAQHLHNTVLIRLVTRFHQEEYKFEKMLIEFIAQDHRQRTELALLWLTELYSQYQGFSFCYNLHVEGGKTKKQERLDRYNRIMCEMLAHFKQQGLHKEVIYYKLILDSPLITSQAIEWLRLASIDPTYGTYGMTALRELILTRNRQRKELLKLLFQLAFHDVNKADEAAAAQKIRLSCIDIIKEFCEVPFLKSDLRIEIVDMISKLGKASPPDWFVPLQDTEPYEWNDASFKNALAICNAVLPTDPTLLSTVATSYAVASKQMKTDILRGLDQVFRIIGMHSELEKLAEDCPRGSETLLARIVSIASQKEPLSKEFVIRFKRLNDSRGGDPRALIPVLHSMEKEDVVKLLPKFFLAPMSNKSIIALHKQLLTGMHNQEALYTPADLLYEYHQMTPEKEDIEEELTNLVTNMKLLLDVMTKDSIAAALERLLDMHPPALLFYSTLEIVYRKCPSLDGFLSNVIQKLVGKKTWQEDGTNKKAIFKALAQLRSAGYAAVLTTFSLEEFNEYMEYVGEQSGEIKKQMGDFLPSLSSQQLKSIDPAVRDLIDDPKERERRAKERREKERRREREKENDKDRDEDRRRSERKKARRS